MSSCTYFPQCEKVKITHIKGNVEFTDEYHPEATMCVPAAYTDLDGKIEGLYRIKGKTYGTKTFKERVSLHPTKGMIISREWASANGFQQHVLVKNGKVRSFKDVRKFRRRALCSDDSSPGSLLIIESTRRMTMNEFAAEVAKHSKNAVIPAIYRSPRLYTVIPGSTGDLIRLYYHHPLPILTVIPAIYQNPRLYTVIPGYIPSSPA